MERDGLHRSDLPREHPCRGSEWGGSEDSARSSARGFRRRLGGGEVLERERWGRGGSEGLESICVLCLAPYMIRYKSAGANEKAIDEWLEKLLAEAQSGN